jgi:hypothetical protein
MIETPLEGRFYGEGRRLVFAAPLPYQAFVKGTGAVGVGMFLAPIVFSVLPVPLPLYNAWWTSIGLMVFVAAIGAALSLQTIVFDLREKTYRRRQGPGLIPRFTRGRLDDLDAIVVLAEPTKISIQAVITYHVVLHWKGAKEPIMIVQRDTRAWCNPINANAGPILQVAQQYAQALGVKFFDNTYFPSPVPVPSWFK